MADYVASQTVSLDDQVSAGASAAADALTKLADAADAASASTNSASDAVTKAGASAATLANRFDPATKAANDLAKAQAALASAQATMQVAVDSGSKTQAQADAVTTALTAKVRAAQAAVDQLGASNNDAAKAAAGLTDANNEAANAATTAGTAHAGLYREIVILGHEVLTGNFSRIPGSLMVLAERSGNLESIMQGVVATVTSVGGMLTIAGVAGVAALGAMALSADNFITKTIAIQNALRATRDDFTAMASEVQSAAHIASNATPGLTNADAVTAGTTLAASPQFAGTQQQLTNLIELAANMGAVFNETADKAATDLANAMENPGQAADKLVGHLRGMTQALADNIKAQADAGDKAGAFAQYEAVVSQAVDGAADRLSPLRQALHDVANAFDDSGSAGNHFGEGLGSAIDNGVAAVVEGVAKILEALKKLHDWDAQYLPWAQGYGQAPGSDGTVAGTISSVGASLNAPPGLISMAQRMAPLESSTGQFNPDGSVVTSSTGALGAMQVEPMNANGNDLTTLQGNVTAAEQLLIQYWTKYHGDERLVAMAYSWGPAKVDAFLAGGAPPPSSVLAYTVAAANLTPGHADVTDGSGGPAPAPAEATANNQADQINQALQKASGSLAAQSTELHSTIALYETALADMQQTGQVGSAAWDKVSSALNTAQLQLSNMQDPFGKLTLQLSNQIEAQDALTGAYGKGYAAVQEQTAANQAEAEALQTVGAYSSFYSTAVADLTAKHLALADATNKTQLAQQTLSNGDQLQYLQAETNSLGMDTAARDEMLAHLKAEQDLRAKNISDLSAEGQAYLASADAVAAQTAALAKNQQTISDLENMATQAFDQIGTAITNAFAQGGKSALDFGNLARTVMSSVMSEVVKLTALNPILNSLFGGSRTTLSDVGGLLGSLGGGASSLGASVGSVGGVTLIGEASSDAPGAWSGGAVSPSAAAAEAGGGGIGNLLSLGGLLWGQGGVGSALGLNGGIGGALGLTGAGGLLNATLWGGDAAAGAGTTLIGSASSNAAGVWSGGAASATSLGSLLGGAGLGFGAGSLFNSLLGGNQLGGSIGSGVGGLAGAAIGSIIPGVGTILGGLLGGLAGGGLGGLFGNNKPSDKTEGYNENLTTSGQTATGNAAGSAEYSDSNLQAASALASTITNAIQGIAGSFGISTGLGGNVQTKVGADGISAELSGKGNPVTSAAFSDAGAATVTNGTVDSWIAKMGSAFDSTTAKLLKEIDYSKSTAGSQLQALAAAITNGQLDATQLQALPNINTRSVTGATSELSWIKNTYEPTVNDSADLGSIATQITAVNTNFDDLIAHAQRLGLSTSALVDAQNKQIDAINTAAAQTIAASNATIKANYQKETGDLLGSDLTTFDQSSAQSQQQLIDEFKGLYGDSYATQKDYVAQVALLTTTLADQRADLIASWQEQQQATNDSVGAGWTANITAGWKAQATIASYSDNLSTVQWGQQLNEDADLQNFDAQAKTQTDSYSQQLISAYGQSYSKTATYAQQMADLEQSLAEQRLAIQAQYAQQAKQQQASAEQSASGVVTNLTSYINSLESGSASPLNAQSQYSLAQTQYDKIAQEAAGGNTTALGELQQYASAFLSASQNLYGSGTQYATDFSNVLAALQAVASIPQTALTADFMQAALQDQTDVLSGNQQEMIATLRAVQLELSQQNARPS